MKEFPTLHEIRDRIISEEREKVTERVKNIAQDQGIGIQMLVRLGDPRSEILKVADEINADMIAVGSTGKGLGQRILLGSGQHLHCNSCKNINHGSQIMT